MLACHSAVMHEKLSTKFVQCCMHKQVIVGGELCHALLGIDSPVCVSWRWSGQSCGFCSRHCLYALLLPLVCTRIILHGISAQHLSLYILKRSLMCLCVCLLPVYLCCSTILGFFVFAFLCAAVLQISSPTAELPGRLGRALVSEGSSPT